MKRVLATTALLCAVSTGLPAFAAEELLIRSAISFHECPATITKMLDQLGADKNHIHTISDTGAHYYVELEASAANLQFRCNAVTEQIEVARVTPGTLNRLAAE